MSVTNEAAKPNPKLDGFKPLIGHWTTTGIHPMVPGRTFHGHATFDWIEGGAFLIMRTQVDEPEIPSGIAIFGTDDSNGECSMIYFDERGVSRRYETSMEGNVWKMWRDAPDISQRFAATISADAKTMTSKGELSKNGGEWEGDLELTYTRE